ncbi:MAG TPA: PQQ-binding-like beta-propeller repeat protein [Terriglobia bacterium]|nr:PQQ-binding-like beta-propeller repeat protein [Terriglobia bacterium]
MSKIIVVLFLSVVTVFSHTSRASDTPDMMAAMFRGDPGHTGVYPTAGKAKAQKELWRFKTGNVNRSTPAVRDGVVYVGSGTGILYAIDAASGNLKWKFATPSEISSSPAVAEGLVYVNSDSGFFAVDAATGRPAWQVKTGEPVAFDHRWDYFQSSPLYAGGAVYFGSADGFIYALEARSGKVLWKYQTAGRVRSSPALAGGVIYVGSMDGNLYALEARTGEVKWKFKTAGDAFFPVGEVQSSPAVADGLVFFGSRDGHLYAVDTATGQEKWAFSHDGSWCISAPAVWEGQVFAGSSDGMFVNAVDELTGKETWRAKTPARVFTSGAIAAGIVYFGTWGGEVNWYDARTGKQVGGTMAEAAVDSSPVISDGVLYFGSDDGYIYAVQLPAPRHTMTSPLNPDLLQAYAGEFQLGSDLKISITREGGKLVAEIPGGGKAELFPQSESLFAIGDTPGDLEFVRAADGSCQQVVFHQSGFDMKLTRVK